MLQIISNHCELEIRIVNASSIRRGPNLILRDKYPDIFHAETFVNVDFLSEIISPLFRYASYWRSNDASCAINGRPKSNKYVMNGSSEKKASLQWIAAMLRDKYACLRVNDTRAHTCPMHWAALLVRWIYSSDTSKSSWLSFVSCKSEDFSMYLSIYVFACVWRLLYCRLLFLFFHFFLLFLPEDLFYCSLECDKTETREQTTRKKSWRFFLSIFSLLCL